MSVVVFVHELDGAPTWRARRGGGICPHPAGEAHAMRPPGMMDRPQDRRFSG